MINGGRMSRSYLHSPWHSVTCSGHRAGNQKRFRSQENRAKRRTVKLRLIAEKEMPHEKEYGNEWASPRDGKTYFGDDKNRPCAGYFTPILGWVNWCEIGYHICCHEAYKRMLRK